MNKYFKNISKIKFEGKQSKNPFSFKFYDPEEFVGNKKMKDHLKFAIAYWHTFQGDGNDPFGNGTFDRDWKTISNPMDLAKTKVEANFEFCEKIQAPYFCFHDRDIAPEGSNLKETNKNLDIIVSLIKEYLKNSDVKLLWGTTNAFSNKRFVHGASTSSNAEVFAYACSQVKKAMEVTKELGGENYVFWGGREGYETLLNTDLKLELDNYARFLQMAVDYKKEISFDGQLLIEPKPKEPTKHQYDFDTATVLGFLSNYGLSNHFKMNIEANHATLANHTFQHELRLSRINGKLGSIDANQGDLLLGWDTDQFPTNIYDSTFAMYEVLKAGGFDKGGLNFDAKLRRASFESKDMFLGHIAGMDTFAIGLKAAYKLIEEGTIDKMISERYKSYTNGIGLDIINNKVGFKELEKYILGIDDVKNSSGNQELLESIVNQTLLNL
ncbi:MAG: xylose isomerase [Clostridiales bacterium]